MMLKILIVLVIFVAIFLMVAASRPNHFRVTREITIRAPIGVVFEQVSVLRKWEAWSPWSMIDPNATRSYDGPTSGVGAGMGWSGNNKVGEGHMAVVESRPNELLRFNLEFKRPFKGTNTAEFVFRNSGNQTTVIWTNFGEFNFIMKAIGLFLNCDKMMGDQFNKGLASLKTISEAAVAKMTT